MGGNVDGVRTAVGVDVAWNTHGSCRASFSALAAVLPPRGGAEPVGSFRAKLWLSRPYRPCSVCLCLPYLCFTKSRGQLERNSCATASSSGIHTFHTFQHRRCGFVDVGGNQQHFVLLLLGDDQLFPLALLATVLRIPLRTKCQPEDSTLCQRAASFIQGAGN